MTILSYIEEEDRLVITNAKFRQISVELVGIDAQENRQHAADLYKAISALQNKVGRKVEKIEVEKKRNNHENLMIYFFEAD